MERDSSELSAAISSDSLNPGRWRAWVTAYQLPSTRRALWQLVNTLIPYLLLWYLMYLTSAVSIWLTLPIAVLAGGFLVRLFIIFHDCGHGSYFRSRRVNDLIGRITGVLTFSPYSHWQWEHAVHHSGAGHLDKRGMGDIWTMTVEEYLAASPRRRLHYRVIRNPFVLFLLAPLLVFGIKHRFPSKKAGTRERRSVWWTNLTLVALAGIMSSIFGVAYYALLQSIILMIAGAAGLWLFYVQHQFEGVYWERGENWDYTKAALQGSSFYKLPKILQWFSGNIGFHHIHHLSPRIPNYNLQRCHESTPVFQQVKPVTFVSSLKSLTLRLWDERRRQLVGFGEIRKLRRGMGRRQAGA